ncbi:MAG: hypothetical protein N2442_06765 [Spirochaetes bacterium]|nr:hypothetical protein [Spirochaetota bacterium]
MRIGLLFLSIFTCMVFGGFGGEVYSEVRIVNRTGYSLVKLYLAPTSRPSWGRNLLKEGMLLNTESVQVALSPIAKKERYFDVMGVDTDGDRYLQSGLDLSKIPIIVLTFRDFLEPHTEGWDWEEYFEEDENEVVARSG